MTSNLRDFLKRYPEFQKSLNNSSVRKEIILPIMKKIMEENQKTSTFYLHDSMDKKRLFDQITQMIDSLDVPYLALWLKNDFHFFQFTNIFCYNFYVFVDKKNPTIGDLAQAANEQLGGDGKHISVIKKGPLDPWTILNPLAPHRWPYPAETSLESIEISSDTPLTVFFGEKK